jgi:alpha-soluble NSF attachment protein
MSDRTENALSKGRLLFFDAEKKVSSIEKSKIHVTPKSTKYEDAAELYTKAAQQYQLAKSFVDAGTAYSKAAECYGFSKFSQNRVPMCCIHAAQNFAKQNVNMALEPMRKGVQLLAEDGKFGQAAKYEKELAEMYQSLDDTDNTIKHYEIAGDYFEMEGSFATGADCWLRVVPLYAAKGQYDKAIEYLEKICEATAPTLAKYAIKDHLVKAVILYLCIPDCVAAKKNLEKWGHKYDTTVFKGTQEQGFLETIVSCAANADVEGFRSAVEEYKRFSKMDEFKETYFKKAEDLIAPEDDDTFV